MTRPELTRKDAVRNSERILAAATTVFARSGLDVTVDDIAREAGVGVATVYRRFADKEQLIDALFESRIDEVVGVAEAALAMDDPWEAICQFVFGFGTQLASDRGLMHVLLSATHGLACAASAKARMEPLVGRLVDRARRAGVLRPEVQLTDFPIMQIMLSGITVASRDLHPDLWKRYAALVLDGLRADGVPRVAIDVAALDPDEVHQVMGTWQPARIVARAP